MIWAAVAAAVGAATLLPAVIRGRPVGTLGLIGGSLTMATALFLFVQAWRAAHRLGDGIERIRNAVLNLVADRDAALPDMEDRRLSPEVRAMLASLEIYQNQITRERRAPDSRLIAVLGSLTGGMLVITDQGQVSILNNAARDLLGARRARVGTSLYAALERKSLMKAVARAEKEGRPVEAILHRLDGVELQGQVSALPNGEGAILKFPPVELERHRPGVEFDLALHDVPPAPGALDLGTPLEELPSLIIDTETTGLDVNEDRIVSFGGVCAHGTRMFKSRMIDDLIDPGVSIPPPSTAIHGITDDMVAGARSFPEVYADFQRMAANRVIIGHNIPFDLTIIRQECARHDRPWEDLVFIDTMRLASLLNPTLRSFSLEALADLYQIDVHGRHTALGDAMVTAELFFRMVPRLQMQGFQTLRALLEFHCHQAVDVIAGQKQAGWITSQPAGLRQAEGRETAS